MPHPVALVAHPRTSQSSPGTLPTACMTRQQPGVFECGDEYVHLRLRTGGCVVAETALAQLVVSHAAPGSNATNKRIESGVVEHPRMGVQHARLDHCARSSWKMRAREKLKWGPRLKLPLLR